MALFRIFEIPHISAPNGACKLPLCVDLWVNGSSLEPRVGGRGGAWSGSLDLSRPFTITHTVTDCRYIRDYVTAKGTDNSRGYSYFFYIEKSTKTMFIQYKRLTRYHLLNILWGIHWSFNIVCLLILLTYNCLMSMKSYLTLLNLIRAKTKKVGIPPQRTGRGKPNHIQPTMADSFSAFLLGHQFCAL